MTLHAQHMIGRGRSCRGAARFAAIDPASGETMAPEFTDATPGEIDVAVELADRAMRSPIEGGRRADFLDTIAAAIDERADAITERARRETGLPEARLVGERGRTTGQLRMFANLVREGSWVDARIDPAMPERQPAPRPDLRRMLVPLGPVVVFGASNFPLAFSVAGGDTASALAAGCPVVVKGHPSHPGTSEIVGEAIAAAAAQCGMPEGTFSLLQGASHEVGQRLVEHPLARAVAFTGSLAGGRALFDRAARRPRPIPVFAEMGSTNPVFVLPGALARSSSRIAGGLAASLTLGVGQFCTNPGVVVSMRGEATSAFIDDLVRGLGEVPAGVMLNPGILEAYRRGSRALSSDEVVDHCGPAGSEPASRARPAVFRTTAEYFLSQPRLREELFGPATLVVECRDADEMVRVAQGLDGQLTATVHAADADEALAARLAPILTEQVGRLIFGGFPTGVEVCPAMQHGGPYPASTDARTTSVGTAAVHRFARPVCYQDCPPALLPAALADHNPLGILRLVDGAFTREAVSPAG